MVRPADLEKFLNDSKLAISHLPELLKHLEDTNSEVVDYAVEAIENCGTPPLEFVSLLCDQAQNKHALVSYWACTLLGRVLQDDSVKNVSSANNKSEPNDFTSHITKTLCEVITDTAVDQSTREKAAVAIGFATSLDSSTQAELQAQLNNATPRLTRLLEAALDKTTT